MEYSGNVELSEKDRRVDRFRTNVTNLTQYEAIDDDEKDHQGRPV